MDYDASYITPWAVLFRRDTQRPDELVFGYERKLWRLKKENLDVRRKKLELVDQLEKLDLSSSQHTELETVKNELSETGRLLEDANQPIHELETALGDITNSEDWHLTQEVERIKNS